MAKSTKKKFLSFLNILILFALFCCLCGCGNSDSTTADGSSATSISMTVASTPNTVFAGQQSIVIAKVINADSTPAVGKTVTFSFADGAATGTSGATINAINSGLTNASGEAWATYTGGSLNESTDIIDVVQANVSDTIALTTITRSMTDTNLGAYSFSSFGSIPETDVFLRFNTFNVENCRLKAMVTSTFLQGIAGIPVTFSIFRGPGTLPAVTTILTDTNGEAWIFFDLPVPGAGNETIVRATVPLIAPQTNGGDAVSVIYW